MDFFFVCVICLMISELKIAVFKWRPLGTATTEIEGLPVNSHDMSSTAVIWFIHLKQMGLSDNIGTVRFIQ